MQASVRRAIHVDDLTPAEADDYVAGLSDPAKDTADDDAKTCVAIS